MQCDLFIFKKNYFIKYKHIVQRVKIQFRSLVGVDKQQHKTEIKAQTLWEKQLWMLIKKTTLNDKHISNILESWNGYQYNKIEGMFVPISNISFDSFLNWSLF